MAANKQIVDAWNKANPNIQVKYVQGDWDSVHDQLLTSFDGGTAPDIIHDEAADIAGFAQQGYLADLTQARSPELKASIPQNIWDSVTFDTARSPACRSCCRPTTCSPTRRCSRLPGITLPTAGQPWTWDAVPRRSAKKLTANGTYGVGWGLKSPTATMLSTWRSTSTASSSTRRGGKTTFKFGAGESKVPQLHPRHDLRPTSRIDPRASARAAATCCPASSPASTR